MELIIGPRTYSTWSLRGWLVMKRTGADFTTVDVRYETQAQKAALRQVSPSGFVPVLRHGDTLIWDTLAIAEWAAETYPEARLWPADPMARALARSATAEMHSGFSALRTFCGTGPDRPMVGEARSETPSDPALDRDLARLVDLFRQMRGRFGQAGPWLFGDWSIADAFFTPVAARIRHFQIDLSAYGDDGVAVAYVAALLAQPDFRQWEAEALA
ncbi:glutathione S-transferase N-terminal domain-containing protein [Brevundimonas sp.]|jgi:glutathione S-transferase|uniref:glutathione S-transferase N-terminal domain-containing protein n=1 Tax=Brevundimonas sp. TaxID=1871086 RepID=UPI001A219442|nr:glutathione S-transferase N-terminal domain-containing protein [Brevundimonas sp.]MBJ7510958.1 glutathione S-transferase N-terminal domain-containing protein [Brevundimonas sp.]